MTLAFVDKSIIPQKSKDWESYIIPWLFTKKYTKEELQKEVEYEVKLKRYDTGKREMIIEADWSFIFSDDVYSSTDVFKMEDRFVALMDKLDWEYSEDVHRYPWLRVYIETKTWRIKLIDLFKLIEEF